ncbi:MAG: hypothetical protein LAP40_14755 [Acidobacteriia bacterium]|nr:hypothetical protein [Terriglobia bacterium]
METHIKVVAILNVILGSMGALAAVIVLLIFGGLAGVVGLSHDSDAATAVPILGGIGGVVFLVLLVLSLPVLIGGIGLLCRTPWSRVYMIVLGAVELINVPFGTALGIYSIWVLTKPETIALFARRPYQAAL